VHSPVPYDVVHFSGHADGDDLIFEDENHNAHPVPLDAIAELLSRKKIKCVILNACSTVKKMEKAIAPFTIGMNDDIEDESAANFSRGFYDALSAGKMYEEAFEEGVTQVRLKGGFADKIILLRSKD
jgi:CHAT domain-containing protein